MQLAFLVSAVIAMAIIVLAAMLPNRPAVDPHAGPTPDDEVGDLDAELEELEDELEELSPGRLPVDGTHQHHPELLARVSR